VYATGGTTPTPSVTPTPTTPAGNLAAGRPVAATSSVDVYVPGNAVDGNASSYWEGAKNAFPQSLTVELGSTVSVGRVALKLPPAAAWATRTQTVAVSGSTDGASFTTSSAAARRTLKR